MAKNNNQEFEELSIGTINGLQAFLSNVQSQYNVGLKKESELIAGGDYEYGDLLHEAFGQVRNTANALIAGLQAGEEVSHKEAFTLQQQYDDLVRHITKPRVVTEASPSQTEPDQSFEIKLKKPSKDKKENHKEIERKNEPVQSRPKTGSLHIVSEDSENIDANERVTVNEQSKKAQSKPVKNKKSKSHKQKQTSSNAAMDHSYKKSIGVVAEKGRQQLISLQKKYPVPNRVQQMLFEEAKEGIEQLELVTKKGGLSKDKQASVAELASYVKHALDGVVEADAVEVASEQSSEKVPVVTEQAKEVIEKTKVSTSPVSFVPTSVTGRKSAITKRPVPKRLQTLPKPDSVYEAESLTAKYLTAPKYQYFIGQNYSSVADFERIIDATVTQVESDTIDQIEKWLGDLPASAFGFIKDMSISELASFANRPHDEVLGDLQRENIKYETFVEWRNLVDEMLELVSGGEEMKFGELFAHWMIELAMQDIQ